MASQNKFAANITLIERHRTRGWIAIIREGKGFIEQSGATDNMAPVAFSTSVFAADNTSIELGDEVEFSLRKVSGRLTAENIVKVPMTIQNFYVRIALPSTTGKTCCLCSRFFRRFFEVGLSRRFVCSPVMNAKCSVASRR